MKIAYFSPFNPQKSGISDYSERLVPFLKKISDVDLWMDGITPSNQELSGYARFDYSKNKKIRSKLKDYDVILYNMGNNPYFHGRMYDVFLEYPGVVILHDYVLFYLVTGYYLHQKKDEQGYIREFFSNYGRYGLDEVKGLLRNWPNLLEYRYPEKFPLIKSLLGKAQGIIVHSNSTRRLVLQNGYPPDQVVHINQVTYLNSDSEIPGSEIMNLKEHYGIRENDCVIGSFGFIAPTKRNLEVIHVMNEISTGEHMKYLMAGEGDYVNGYLSGTILKTGYVSSREFGALLQGSEIVVNLRNPSMGETSATLIRAMSEGKPCIVSDTGWFSELPDDVVIKISCDPVREREELARELRLLLDDPDRRSSFGNRARDYAEHHHDPGTIVQKIAKFLEYCMKNNER
jgi:glycosyltransferase involved in cell wall biosynthesis